MHFIRCASITLLVFLGGCAGSGLTKSGETPSANAAAGAASNHTGGLVPLQASTVQPAAVAVIPGGPLAPLMADPSAFQTVTSLLPPADLWERIRRGFAMPDLDNDLVHERERWYVDRPDYIVRMTERSRKYLFHVVEELELRGMPTELALLPFVESAFNPQALSSAKAAGMWQFMPATGKHFELKQNAFRDDRRDVIASTDAALDYLQKLHDMFGDWHLALAAYNWGEGNVGRAIKKNQRSSLGTAYTELAMPAETRQYVPKLQALKNIVASPEKFAATFQSIGNHPYFDTVAITHDIDVDLAAKLANVELDDFKALNPSVNRPMIMAAGTPQILLPWDNATVFEVNLKAYAGTPTASWTVWQAPATMAPAAAAKSVGMSEPQLRAVNHIPAGVVINKGSTLLVPRAATVQEDVAGRIADEGQLSFGPQLTLVRKSVKAGKRESVASLAMRYRVSARSVANWNGVDVSSRFKPGQPVTIYLQERTGSAKSRVAAAKAPVKRNGKGQPIRMAGE